MAAPLPRRHRFAPLAMVAVVVASGCGLGNAEEPELIARGDVPAVLFDDNPNTQDARPGDWRLAIFVVASTNGRQVLEAVEVSIAPTPDVVKALLETLLTYAPPASSARQGSNLIPPSTVLRNVRREGGIVEIDLSRFTVEGPGQSQAFAQIVFTVTQFTNIQAVRFSVDGRPVAVPLGDRTARAGQAVGRSDFPDLDPSITTAPPPMPTNPPGTAADTTPGTRPGPSGSSTSTTRR